VRECWPCSAPRQRLTQFFRRPAGTSNARAFCRRGWWFTTSWRWRSTARRGIARCTDCSSKGFARWICRQDRDSIEPVDESSLTVRSRAPRIQPSPWIGTAPTHAREDHPGFSGGRNEVLRVRSRSGSRTIGTGTGPFHIDSQVIVLSLPISTGSGLFLRHTDGLEACEFLIAEPAGLPMICQKKYK
jgi:hypothetical protein